jgi:hypothetical protein
MLCLAYIQQHTGHNRNCVLAYLLSKAERDGTCHSYSFLAAGLTLDYSHAIQAKVSPLGTLLMLLSLCRGCIHKATMRQRLGLKLTIFKYYSYAYFGCILAST